MTLDGITPSMRAAFDRAMKVLLQYPDQATRSHSAKVSLGMNWNRLRWLSEQSGLDFDAVCDLLADEYVEKAS
jgi:hypothetical protein